MSIVMGTNTPKRIGERVVGCWDEHGEFHSNQPVVILRESDRSAWLAYLAACGYDNPREGVGVEAHFYEVATD